MVNAAVKGGTLADFSTRKKVYQGLGIMFGIPAILAFTVTGISWWSKPNTRYEFVPAISPTIEQQVTNAYANALRKYGDTDGDCTVLVHGAC